MAAFVKSARNLFHLVSSEHIITDKPITRVAWSSAVLHISENAYAHSIYRPLVELQDRQLACSTCHDSDTQSTAHEKSDNPECMIG